MKHLLWWSLHVLVSHWPCKGPSVTKTDPFEPAESCLGWTRASGRMQSHLLQLFLSSPSFGIFFLLHFRSGPVLLSAAEVLEHIKSWWRLTGFNGVLWSCRLQLWGEDSLSFPAVSFVWALGIVEKEEVKQEFWKRIQTKPYFLNMLFFITQN